MIRLQNVSKSYQIAGQSLQALSEINLSVQRGEIFGVIGASGAGKSTLIRCVNLLERPTSGGVCVDETTLTELSAPALREARKKIGMIFQHFNLLSSKTVFENVALGLKIAGASAEEIAAEVMPLLALTGLSDKKDSYPNALSGGQKQRVAIARALALKPKVLLCDECTSALDPGTTNTILKLLKDINTKLGLTIMLITHEMDVIKSICDRVAVIDNGQIVELGETLHFFKQPKTEVGKSLIHTNLKHDLPESIEAMVHQTPTTDSCPLWRIWFDGGDTTKPLLAECLHRYNVVVNILQANIEYIHGQATGIMLCNIQGEKDNIERSKDFFTENNITIETIGYVNRNDFAVW